MSETVSVASGSEILFFDLAEIAELRGVSMSVCTATKHPANPVMAPGDQNAWDSAQASPWAARTVLYDGGERLFKCWYNGTTALPDKDWHMGYAVSADGVAWEKPALGLVEFNGSRRNNILLDDPYGCVIKDLAEPDPARRYKMRQTRACRYSPDGIHWSEWQFIDINWDGPTAWDAVAFIRDDMDPDPARRYKFVFQYYDKTNKPGPEEARFKAMVFGATELDWNPAPAPMLCPNDGFEHENHFLMLIPYKGHYLALYECGWYQPDGTGKYGRYLADIRLAHSRDGVHFTRINPEQVVIPRGGPGEWDGQFIVISDKLVVHNDTLHLYYCGQGNDWASWPPGNAVDGALIGPGSTSISSMGLATLRPDGFTCLHAADRTSFGEAVTQPLVFEGDAPPDLAVNLGNVRAGSDWLQVEVLDADTREPLPGFTRVECPRIATDGVRVPVRWAGRSLADCNASAFRLRLLLFGRAELHGLRFG